MKKSNRWVGLGVCAATLSLFLATNTFADETQTTSTTNSSTMAVSSSSSTPVAESTETSAMSTETTTTQSSSANSADEVAAQTAAQEVKTQLSAEIKNIDTVKGSYDVVVRGISGSGIHHVKVPIWSTPNQSDIKWYDAVKQADGSYLVHMSISNHKNHRGSYHTHVYMYNNDHAGKAIALSNTNLPDVNTKLEAEIKNVNVQNGSYDVVVSGQISSGIKEIYVPIWSDKNQKDIKWYKAIKQSDGSYIVHMNIANHKYNRGEYMTHVYMYGNNGKVKAKSLGYTSLPDNYNKLTAEIVHLNGLNGTYDVVVKG